MKNEKLEVKKDDLLTLTSNIVSAYVSNNKVESSRISELIENVYINLVNVKNNNEPRTRGLNPAVPVKKSVTPDHIVCLEDGKKLKMIKRHLRAVYGMSIEEYKEKWGLPSDYPTVAPNYARQRSQLARDIGLGKGSSRI